MRKSAIRFLSILLSCLLAASGLSVSLAADFDDIPSMSDAEMQAYIDAFWVEYDEEGGAVGDLAIKGLKLIGGAIGEKIGGYIGNEIWKALFGDAEAERHAEIINRLKAIEAKLDVIIGMLRDLMHDQKLGQYKDSIQRKLTLMAEAKNMLDNRASELQAATTQEAKHKILDEWYAMSVGNQRNSIDFFTYYCGMVANKEGMNMDGEYFAQYDIYASLAWDWTREGIPFRQAQREKDLMFISKMAAMNILWLNKEKEQHPENMETLKQKEAQMKAAIDLVVASYEKNSFEIDPKVSELHGDGQSMTVYIGTEANAIAPTNQLQTHQQHLDARHETHDIRNGTRAMFDAKTPSDLTTPGQSAHLITRSEFEFLAKMAAKNKRTVRDYLVTGGGFPYQEDMQYISFCDETNQPVSFGSTHGTALSYRYMYYEVADITKENTKINTLVGDVSVRVLDKDVFWGIADSSPRSAVVRVGENDHLEFFETAKLYPIWVVDGTVPVVEKPEETLSDDSNGEVQGTIERVEDGALVLLWAEKEAKLQLAIDDNTQYLDPNGGTIAATQLIGAMTKVAYAVQGADIAELSPDGSMPLYSVEYLATSVTAIEDVSPEPIAQSAEGQITAIDEVMEIIGGAPVITLAVPGGEMSFRLPDGLPDGLAVDAMVRVRYHVEDDVNIADNVDVMEQPVPEDGVIDGQVIRIDKSEEIIGLPPILTVSAPGGNIDLHVLSGLPHDLDEGSMVHAHYTIQDDVYVADSIIVVFTPAPVDDPFDPVPAPDDGDHPFDPVRMPQWAEGTVEQLLVPEDVPGAPRTLSVMANVGFVFQLPTDVVLTWDVVPGDLVHVDFHTDAAGENIADAIMLLTPAPAPAPAPDPSPEDDPMPGPITDDNGEDEPVFDW